MTVSFPKPKTLIAVIIFTVIVGFTLYTHVHAVKQFQSCTQAEAAGYHDIPSTSPVYQARLDRNHNKIACEL